MKIETSRLRLCPAELNHAKRLFEIYNDAETIRHWNGPDKSPQDSEDRILRMRAHWKNHGYGDWALLDKKSGTMIGYCGLHHISGMEEVNLGFLLDRSFWGKGLATEAGKASLEFGFARAKLEMIVGTTAPNNEGAVKVLQKCGMSYWKGIVRNGPRSVFKITDNEWSKLQLQRHGAVS